MVITRALRTVPVSFPDLWTGVRHKPLQLVYQPDFTAFRIHIRAMVPAILRQAPVSVPEPRTLSFVFRMVLQHATAEVAGIMIVRGGLRSTSTGQTTITIESDKGFCVQSIVPYRQTTHRRQLSRYGQHGQDVNGGSVKKYQKGSKSALAVVTVRWLSH